MAPFFPIRLFKYPHCSGKEMNALIELITACVNYSENKAEDMRRCLIEPDHFDPLLIETDACTRRPSGRKLSFLSSHSLLFVGPIGAKTLVLMDVFNRVCAWTTLSMLP